MSCADVCLDMDYYYDCEQWSFSVQKLARAKKAHVCGECVEGIAAGSTYERVTGKWDGAFLTLKTCAVCYEIREAFVCGNWAHGLLWETIRAEMFPVWRNAGPFDCLAKLTTEGAIARCNAEFADWMADE